MIGHKALLHEGVRVRVERCSRIWRRLVPADPREMDDGDTAIGKGEQDVVAVMTTGNWGGREPVKLMRGSEFAVKLG